MLGKWDVNTVVHADAVSLLSGLPDGSVDCIVTDPPYGVGYHSNYYKDKNPHAPIAHDWNFQIGAFFPHCERVLKDGGAMYLFCRWDVTPLWIQHITGRLKLKTIVVWVKDNWSAGDLEGSFGNQYEQLLFITKGKHKLRGKRWSNVWSFPRIPAKRLLHPAQKPTELLARAICSSTDEGDIVVDPFAGSGSTGEACQRTRRRFVLGDVDPQMVTMAGARLHLPVDVSGAQANAVPPPDYLLRLPDYSDWGVHPEDLAFIAQELRGNVIAEFAPPCTIPLFSEAL